MKKIFYLLGSLLLVLMVFSTCKKSEVQKANDDYDFNGMVPIVLVIDGPEITAASGLATLDYSVPYRGGSTWNWEVVGYGATVTVGSPSNSVEIMFAQSDLDTVAQIKVIETTSGGVSSVPKILDVELKKFKPMTWDEFVGDWAGTEADGDSVVTNVAFSITKGADENTIVIPCINGTPSLMGPLFQGWGELFQGGFGQEGRVILELDLNSGAVTISCQYWGQTLPGPYDYWILGEGTWEGINQSMTFGYGIQWDDACDGDGYNYSSMTITKQ